MAAWRVVLAIAVASVVVDGVIKQVVFRPRPFEVVPEARLIAQRPLTSAFPSGHAARAFAGALAVSRLIPAWQPAWWALAALIGVSRVYVGVHWPSDVVAGALLGLAVAWFTLGGRSVVRWSRTVPAALSPTGGP
jgi:undecaprenyl-diphosphatase